MVKSNHFYYFFSISPFLFRIVGSPWRDRISLTILDLQEKGIIQMLYDKWWKSPGLTCIRDELTKKDGKAAALGADNIGGVFVVLLFGLAFAVLTAMFEFFWHSRKLAKNSRVSEFFFFQFLQTF